MKFIDFCAGIGAGRLGLEKAGMTCVGYSEINRSAIKSYNLLHNTVGEVNFGNLTKIVPENLPDFDLAIAGFPCQTFSVIGRQEGFKDPRGQIIFYLIDILKAKKVKYFVFENVKGLTTHDDGRTIKIIIEALQEAGYDVSHKVLTSMSYGVPQMRQRVYFVGIRKDLTNIENLFKWAEPTPCKKVSEVLVSENNEITQTELEYLVQYLKNKTNQNKVTLDEILKKEYVVVDTRQSDLRFYYNRIPTLRSFRDGLYYVKGGKLRSLTGYEAMLIQGFPKDYADRVAEVASRDLLRQAGNAMTVGVIESIGRSLQYFTRSTKEKAVSTEEKVLVGMVKSQKQFDYCLEKNIYYTYKKSLITMPEDFSYIAIYQPKSAFGFEKAGVFLYGKIKKIYNVKRSQIHFEISEKKKDQECAVFQVEEWQSLENPILAVGNAKVLIESTYNKLSCARIYSDL